jgi:hypothetical protein
MGMYAEIGRSSVLRDRARRCRVLATGLSNDADRKVLECMAEEYEAEARQLDWGRIAANDDLIVPDWPRA